MPALYPDASVADECFVANSERSLSACSGSGHGFLRFVWHTILYIGVVAAVVGAAVYARKANVMAVCGPGATLHAGSIG
jgi:hypothetical protein